MTDDELRERENIRAKMLKYSRHIKEGKPSAEFIDSKEDDSFKKDDVLSKRLKKSKKTLDTVYQNNFVEKKPQKDIYLKEDLINVKLEEKKSLTTTLLSRFKKDKIQKKPEKKLPKKQEIPQISAPQQKPKELKFDDTNSKVKTVLLEGHNEATKEEKNFNFNQLLFALLLIVFAVLLFVPQIYIRNNIYYLSREIAILRSQESVLSEENKEIRKALENMRFQNQILDYLE